MIEIAKVQLAGDVDDGLTFDVNTVTAELIREEKRVQRCQGLPAGPSCDRCRALSYRRQRGRSHLAGPWPKSFSQSSSGAKSGCWATQ